MLRLLLLIGILLFSHQTFAAVQAPNFTQACMTAIRDKSTYFKGHITIIPNATAPTYVVTNYMEPWTFGRKANYTKVFTQGQPFNIQKGGCAQADTTGNPTTDEIQFATQIYDKALAEEKDVAIQGQLRTACNVVKNGSGSFKYRPGSM